MRLFRSGLIAGLLLFLCGPVFCGDNSGISMKIFSPEMSSALAFNGRDNYITFKNHIDELNLNRELSVECWVNSRERSGGWLFIISRATYDLFLDNDYPSVRITYENNKNTIIKSGRKIIPGQWTHIAFTYDGEKILKLYQDGVLYAETSNCSGKLNSNLNDVKIGSAKYLKYYFPGAVDDVRISRAVRDVPELWMQGAYHAGLQTDDKTVGLWHFDEEGGDIVLDSSGNELTGNLINNPEYVDSVIHSSPGHTFTPEVAISIVNKVPVSAWYLSDSPDKPSPDSLNWSAERPTGYELKAGDYGRKMLYCWMKDKDGGIMAKPASAVITYFSDSAESEQ